MIDICWLSFASMTLLNAVICIALPCVLTTDWSEVLSKFSKQQAQVDESFSMNG